MRGPRGVVVVADSSTIGSALRCTHLAAVRSNDPPYRPLAPGATPRTAAPPPHLPAGERAGRAGRGGASRSVPAPLLAPALIAVGFRVLPLIGLLTRAPWGRIGAALSGADA